MRQDDRQGRGARARSEVGEGAAAVREDVRPQVPLRECELTDGRGAEAISCVQPARLIDVGIVPVLERPRSPAPVALVPNLDDGVFRERPLETHVPGIHIRHLDLRVEYPRAIAERRDEGQDWRRIERRRTQTALLAVKNRPRFTRKYEREGARRGAPCQRDRLSGIAVVNVEELVELRPGETSGAAAAEAGQFRIAQDLPQEAPLHVRAPGDADVRRQIRF